MGFSSVIYRVRTRGSERLSKLPKGTQPGSSKCGIPALVLLPLNHMVSGTPLPSGSALLPSLDLSITINPLPQAIAVSSPLPHGQSGPPPRLVREQHSTSGPQTGQDPMAHLPPKQGQWDRCWMVTRRSQDRRKQAKEIVWKIKCSDGRQGPLGLLT